MHSRYAFNIVATVVGAFSTFLIIPVLIQYFGTEIFGLISQFFVVVAFIPLFELGLIQSTIQYLSSKKEGDKDISPSFKAHLILLSVLIIISILGFAIILNQSNGLFSNLEEISGSSTLIYIILVTLILRVTLPVLTIVDFVNGNVERITVITLISNFFRNILLVAVVVTFDLNFNHYFVGYLLFSIFDFSIFLYYRVVDKRNFNIKKISLSQLISQQFFKSALKIWILIISWNGLMQYERLVLSYVLEPSEFSIIWTISSLAAAVMLITAPLNGFTLPKLNSVHLDNLKEKFENVVYTYTLLIFIPSIFALLYQKEIFEIWLSRELSSDKLLIFTIYLLGNLVHILSGFAYFIRYRFGISTRFITITLLLTIIQAILIYLSSKYYGALGTSLVWLMFALISLFFLSIPKFFIIDNKLTWFTKVFLPLVITFTLFMFFWKFITSLITVDTYLLFMLGTVGIFLFIVSTIKISNYKVL